MPVLVFEHSSTCVLVLISVYTCLCTSVFRSIYKQKGLMLFLSVGQALPSHYTGSRTNHRLCVSVSPNLSPFSLLSLVIFLFHSLRQLPSSTGPQSTLITFSFCMHSISLAALSISPDFFFFLLSVKLPCVTVSSLFCQVSTLLIAHCFLLYVIYFLFLSPQLKIWILRSMYTW